MRDNKLLTAFLLGLITALLFGYTRSWTESTPTDNTVANQIDDFNRYLRVDTAERVETYIAGFNSGDSNEGFYHVLFIENAASLSTPAANKFLLYGKLVDGKCELHGMDEDGDEIQLTSGGISALGHLLTAKTSAYTILATDARGNQTFTNTGASAVVPFTLPPGVVNYEVSFIVTDTDGIRIDPNGSENFVDFTRSSAGGKYISSSTVGNAIKITWNNAASGEWQITEIIGIWDIES